MPDDNLVPDTSQERHTGADSLLKINIDDTYYEVPVTNVDWNRDYTIEEVQHNGSLNPTLTVSEIRYSGSFEYEGQNPGLIKKLMHDEDNGNIDRNRPRRFDLTIKEYNHDDGDEVEATITFTEVLVESNDRTVSSAEVSSTTFSWQAENMKYVDGATG